MFCKRKAIVAKFVNDNNMVYFSKNALTHKNPTLKILPSLPMNILTLGWKRSKKISKIIPHQYLQEPIQHIITRNLSRTITPLKFPYKKIENLLSKQTNYYLNKLPNLRIPLLANFLKMQGTNFDLTLNCQNSVKNVRASQHMMFFNTKSELLEKFFSKQIVTKKEKSAPKEEVEENWGGQEAFKSIIFVKEDIDGVLNRNPSVLMFFSASWCQHCLKLRKPFGRAALMAKEANLPMVFATFDVNTNPDVADEKGVVGIPTLKYYLNGKFVSNFKGKRTAEDLFDFAKNPPPAPATEGKKADI